MTVTESLSTARIDTLQRFIESDRVRNVGITHAQAGAYLLAKWGLPLRVVECVAFHHQPELVVDEFAQAEAA